MTSSSIPIAASAKKRTTAKRSPKAAKLVEDAAVDTAQTEEFDALLADAGFKGQSGPIAEDGTIRPIEVGKRGRTPNPMVDLFTLDGGKSYYQVPAKPPAMLAFRYQERLRRTLKIKDLAARKAAQELATRELFISLLGDEALDALAESPELTDEDVADVFAVIAHLAFGSVKKVEDAQGN